MNGSSGSRLATLGRAQVAMALTVADGLRRYADLTASYAEELARAASVVAREANKREGSGWDRAATCALSAYRDYVRELAALPGIASMHYYDQLGRLRVADGVPQVPSGAPVPLPTAGMVELASTLAASTPRSADRGYHGAQEPPAPPKEHRGEQPA